MLKQELESSEKRTIFFYFFLFFSVLQAQPLFKDRRHFTLMADPLLEGNYPVKALYQALAVAAMCLQEEADTRPLISDVVTALEFLGVKKTDEDATDNVVDTNSEDSYSQGGGNIETENGESKKD